MFADPTVQDYSATRHGLICWFTSVMVVMIHTQLNPEYSMEFNLFFFLFSFRLSYFIVLHTLSQKLQHDTALRTARDTHNSLSCSYYYYSLLISKPKVWDGYPITPNYPTNINKKITILSFTLRTPFHLLIHSLTLLHILGLHLPITVKKY